jgi:hypothetical protein
VSCLACVVPPSGMLPRRMASVLHVFLDASSDTTCERRAPPVYLVIRTAVCLLTVPKICPTGQRPRGTMSSAPWLYHLLHAHLYRAQLVEVVVFLDLLEVIE